MKMLKKIVLFVLFVFILGLLYSCQEDTTITNAAPIISGATEVDIYLFDSFDALNGVSANDLEDGNITASIQLSGDTVDTSVVGTYEIIYTVEDSAGNTTTIRRIVNVLAIDESLYPLADYPLGIDLSLLPASQKAILFSALERYLTEHLYGGIPLYYRGEGRLYSSRLSLYFDEYSSLFSYGEMYSSMTGDDSSVYMIGDQLGNELEYTLRLSYRYADESLNPWTAESG
ncbi:MAG: immunoglobulin-like domain-containing protein, partial [Candidatus Izemoplasmatales bacterium]